MPPEETPNAPEQGLRPSFTQPEPPQPALTPAEAAEFNELAPEFGESMFEEFDPAVADRMKIEDEIIAGVSKGIDNRGEAYAQGFTEQDYQQMLDVFSPQAVAARKQAEAEANAPKEKGGILKGIGAGLIRAPAQALGGTIDFAADLGTIGADGLVNGISKLDQSFFDNQLIPRLKVTLDNSVGFQTLSGLGDLLVGAGDADGDGFTDFADKLSGKSNDPSKFSFASIGNDTANQLTTEVGSVLMAFGGLRTATTRTGLTTALKESTKQGVKGTAKEVGKDAVIGGVAAQVLDPDKERLSNTLLNLGVPDPGGFLSALAQDEDETRAKARLALFAEDSIVGAAADSVLRVGIYGFHAMRGNTKALAEIEAEVAKDLPTTPVSDEVVPPSSPAPVADAPQDVIPGSPAEAVTNPEVLPDDAFRTEMEGFAKRAGVTDDIGKLDVADGRFVVPDGKAAQLNKQARAEGSPQDIFVDASKRSVAVEGGGSIRQEVLDSLKTGADIPSSPKAKFRLNSTQGAIAAGREFISALPPTQATATPPTPRSNTAILDEAKIINDGLGMDVNTGREFLRELGGEVGDLDTRVKRAQLYVQSVYKDLDDIDINTVADLGDDALEDVMQRIHNAHMVGELQVKIGSGLGRGLQARRGLSSEEFLSHVKNPQRALEFDRKVALGDANTPGLPYSRETAIKWLQDFKETAGSPSQRAALLKDGATVPGAGFFLANSITNLFTASILSGINTFTTNVFAPSLVAPLRTLSKLSGGVSRSAFLAATGNPQAAAQSLDRGLFAAQAHLQAFQQAGSLVAHLTHRILTGNFQPTVGGAGSVGQRGAEGVIEATRRGSSVLRSGNFLDTQSATRVDVKSIEDTLTRAQKTGYMLGNAINFLPRYFQQANAGVDELANRVSYAGEVAYHLFEQAQKEGLSGSAARDFVKRKMPDALTAENGASSAFALREAQRTTLTGRPGTPGGASETLLKAINSVRRTNPLIRTILPIFNVPMNGVGEALRLIPGSNVILKELRDDLAGKRGDALRDEAWGRWQLGTAMMATGYGMAQSGMLTGAGPSDFRARKRWMELGYRPYSFRTSADGDWIDYTRADQPGAILGMMAAFNDQTIATNDIDKHKNAVLTGAGTLASFFRDKSALQGAVNVLSADDAGLNQNNLSRVGRSVGSSLAVPTFVNNTFKNPKDPVIRKRNNLIDDIRARIPIASEHLAPVLNSFGEPVYTRRDQLHENIVPFLHDSPRPEGDIVMDAMEELYMATGGFPGIFMDSHLLGGKVRTQDVILDDLDHGREEGNEFGNVNAWDISSEYVYARGNVKIDGQNLREALAELVSSDVWTDDSKSVFQPGTRKLSSDGRLSRNKMVSDIFRDYGKAARADLSKRSEKFARVMAVKSLKNSMGTALREVDSIDIVNDPSILKGLVVNGVDVEQEYLNSVSGLRGNPEEENPTQ